MAECMIRRVSAEELEADPQPYCELLMDAVGQGASVGFLLPLDPVEVLSYWDEVRRALYGESAHLLGAFVDGRLVGCVQLLLAMRANGRHRAEVAKLLVHSAVRRRGVGTALMQAVEGAAQGLGRALLVLDTRVGDASEALYRKLGYQQAGVIPGYAQSVDGTLHATVLLYKELGGC